MKKLITAAKEVVLFINLMPRIIFWDIYFNIKESYQENKIDKNY